MKQETEKQVLHYHFFSQFCVAIVDKKAAKEMAASLALVLAIATEWSAKFGHLFHIPTWIQVDVVGTYVIS